MCRSAYCPHRWVDTNTGTLTYAGRQRQLDRTWTDWVVVNSSTANTQVWTEWTIPVTSATATYTVHDGTLAMTGTWVVDAAELTAEAAVEERRAQAERRREREAEVAMAKERAEALLLSCLDEEQKAELRAHDRFHVTAPSGRRYCIKRGRAGNVSARDGNRIVRYCIHDYVGLPDADTMLGQKLMLETDESGFLETANASY